MSLTLSPRARQQFCNGAGVPYAGGQLFTYAAGTTTPLATYSDIGGTVANPNPVILDANGVAPAIYLLAAAYKFSFFDVNGVAVPDLSQDNVPSVGLQSSSLGTGFPMGGDPTSPVSVTSYPSGTTYDKLHAGTIIIPLDSANLNGTYALRGMLRGSGGTITAGLVNLTDGTPDTALIEIASNDANGVVQTSAGITFAAAGATKNYGIKTKVSAGQGWAWMLGLVRIA